MKSIITKGRRKYRLFYVATGQPASIGETVISGNGEVCKLKGFTPPHHAGSTGRVIVAGNSGDEREYFPQVFGLHIVDLERDYQSLRDHEDIINEAAKRRLKHHRSFFA